jgi:hypothetical protein
MELERGRKLGFDLHEDQVYSKVRKNKNRPELGGLIEIFQFVLWIHLKRTAYFSLFRYNFSMTHYNESEIFTKLMLDMTHDVSGIIKVAKTLKK